MHEIILDTTSRNYKIVQIEWERIFLNIEVEVKSKNPISFKLRRVRNRKAKNINYLGFDQSKYNENEQLTIIDEEINVEHINKVGNIYKIEMNITAINDRLFLENGRWQLIAVDNDQEYACIYNEETAYKQDDYSRIFRYGNGKYAYNISFSSYEDNKGNLVFILNSYFLIQNKSWKKRKYVQEAITFLGKVNRLKLSTVITLMKAYYYIIEKFIKKDGKNILLMSETKPKIWGNLKAINDRMIERGLDKELNLTYSFRVAVGNNQSVKSWIKLINLIAKQDVILVDDYVPVFGFLNLSKRTKLIQVWHAGEGFKSVGYSRFGKTGTPWPVESSHKKYNYVVTGSKKLVKVFSEVFGLPEKYFYPFGMARLDGFLDQDKIDAFKHGFYKKYPQFIDKKIILFAPTFRGTGQSEATYDYSKIDLKQIYEFCSEENYVFLIKMHPFVKDKIKITKKQQDLIYDFGDYLNINDLYYITDLLITDYSSNYFEYALMKRPVLFYTYDRVAYELVRGVHRSVKESAPGKVCDTFDEMMLALKNKDFEIEKIYEFVEENFSEYDGKASDRIIDELILKREK